MIYIYIFFFYRGFPWGKQLLGNVSVCSFLGLWLFKTRSHQCSVRDFGFWGLGNFNRIGEVHSSKCHTEP